MQKKCYTIQSNNNSKYKIIVDYNKNGNPEIYIGGSKHYCISITGFILDVKSGNSCHDLHIRNVNFSHKASDMMKALLYFVRIQQEEIGYRIDNKCEITFIDTSSNQFCGDLSSYYLAFYKQTWYEKDFGAYLINNTKNKLTPRQIRNLQIHEKYILDENVFDVVNMYKDKKQIFDDYKSHTNEIKIAINTSLQGNVLDREIIENVLNIYDKTSTIYEFFNQIKIIYRDKCKELNLALWLDKFIKFTLGFYFIKNQIWKIDCDIILEDNTYKINECEQFNVSEKYLAVNQTGSGEKKKLTERQRYNYKNPNWIGWFDININEYSKKDRLFLNALKKKLFR